jgi:hypothetical protein
MLGTVRLPASLPLTLTNMDLPLSPAPTEKVSTWVPADSRLTSYSSHSPAVVQPTSQPPRLGPATPISTGLSLSQGPCCLGVESSKRSKASDCTVTGTVSGTPLEELLEEALELLLEEELVLLELLLVELEELELVEELAPLVELLLDELVLDELEELLVDELLLLVLADELLLEEELLEELEPGSLSPWVTNNRSPPHAVKAVTTRPKVKERKDLPRKPEDNMKNTPHKCVKRLHVQHPEIADLPLR